MIMIFDSHVYSSTADSVATTGHTMCSRKLGTLHHYYTSFCEHCRPANQFVVRQLTNITVLPVNDLNTVHVKFSDESEVRASISSV